MAHQQFPCRICGHGVDEHVPNLVTGKISSCRSCDCEGYIYPHEK